MSLGWYALALLVFAHGSETLVATASADKPTARYAGGTAGAQWKGTKKIAVDTVEALAGPAASEVASSSPTMRPHNNGKSVRHGAPTDSRDAKNLHVHKNGSGVAESLQQVTRMVHIIMRHGQRTPKFVLPNDDRKNWPEHLGPGMLTASGALTMTQLGAEERARYIGKEHLLSPSYVRDEVYVRSTDIDRSLQSAESFLRGFFPSRGIALFPQFTCEIVRRYSVAWVRSLSQIPPVCGETLHQHPLQTNYPRMSLS